MGGDVREGVGVSGKVGSLEREQRSDRDEGK
jgi:hypothetical protein